MQKNRFATYLSMALSLVGLVLLLALPFVNMQGVRSFSFFGLLSGSGFLKALVMVLALVAPVAAIVLPLLKKKGLGAIAALLGVILVWVAYSLQVGPYGHACTMGAGGTLYFLVLLAALVLLACDLAHGDGTEPFIRISKRSDIAGGKALGIRLISVVLAMLVCAVIIYAIVKLNPLKVYASLFDGAFGTSKRIWFTLRDTMILTCIAIGLAPAFKMRFWNVGAEGQMLIGGIATAFFMINFSGKMPVVLLFACMIVFAVLCGGIWGLIPGFFKARWNTNETLFTLMMNYIAIQLTSFCVAKWENPYGSNVVGIINKNSKIGWLGNMFSDGYNGDFMWTVIVVVLLAVAMYLYLKYTKHGFEISVVGDSENTARYAGIRVNRIYVRTMALSGAICGFAGFLAVAAVSHTISTSTANGRGFTAIIVAWLAKMNPFIMILISALLTFLDKGAIQIASTYGLNEYASQIITGVTLFFILGSEFFVNYKVKFRRQK